MVQEKSYVGIIYKITNIINGKIYVGKTEKSIDYRWKKHLKCAENKVNRHLYDAMNRYGVDNFKIEEVCRCNAREELNKKEKEIILFYNSTNKNKGYNMQDGGLGGAQPLEVRIKAGKKISLKNKGKIVSKETREKISKSHVGIKPSLDSINKIKSTLKRLYKEGKLKIKLPPIRRGSEHPMFGKTHTKETRQKISNARRGKTYEDIFGKEMASVMREKSRIRFITNNPTKKNIDRDRLLFLVNEKKKVSEIALILGVSSPTVISNFKNYFGTTIEKYRGRLIR